MNDIKSNNKNIGNNENNILKIKVDEKTVVVNDLMSERAQLNKELDARKKEIQEKEQECGKSKRETEKVESELLKTKKEVEDRENVIKSKQDEYNKLHNKLEKS